MLEPVARTSPRFRFPQLTTCSSSHFSLPPLFPSPTQQSSLTSKEHLLDPRLLHHLCIPPSHQTQWPPPVFSPRDWPLRWPPRSPALPSASLPALSLPVPRPPPSRPSSASRCPPSSLPPARSPRSVPTLLRSPRPWSRSPRTWVWVLPPLVSPVPVSVSVSSSPPSSTVLPATPPSVASSSPMPFSVSLSSRPLVFST
ncbi:hypothetical protein QC761_509140 [Podospora bellae-mahoneyi]|uniref:Uncharacterized protein n=1 Tax=Podospora bellae-mahoneyi TaxID=2093777 RepID=A0ABR0FHI4_9PEZI|nr:hypothetical protein QC761_509140 [Podospora bellae-mahoneyi]